MNMMSGQIHAKIVKQVSAKVKLHHLMGLLIWTIRCKVGNQRGKQEDGTTVPYMQQP